MTNKAKKVTQNDGEYRMLSVLKDVIEEIDSVSVVDELEMEWEDRARRILSEYDLDYIFGSKQS